MTNLDADDAQQLLGSLAQALRDASTALAPLAAQLQADGKWDDAQKCMRAQSDLLNLSTQANAIDVEVILQSGGDVADKLQRITKTLAAKAAALAADEANVARIVGIATAAGQIVTALCGGGGVIAAASSMSGLLKLLG